jgi:integrase
VNRKSNPRRPRRKLVPPAKPYPAFPLSCHSSGKFQKRINGRLCYFGAWATRKDGELVPVEDGGWEKALAEYEAKKAELEQAAQAEARRAGIAAALKANEDAAQAGREEQQLAELAAARGLRMVELCNRFLDFKMKKVGTPELKQCTFDEYVSTTDLLIEVFGKDRIVEELRPQDFSDLRGAMVSRKGRGGGKWSPGRVQKFITMTRTVFKFAFKSELVEKAPNYGHDFDYPSDTWHRKHKAEGGKKLFTRDEVLKLINGDWCLDKAGRKAWRSPSTNLRCMFYLAINCAFKNTDIGELPLKAIDLKSGLITFPRPKTGVQRECPLWPETIKAIEDVLAERPKTKLPNLFITSNGFPYVHGRSDAIKKPTKTLMGWFRINGRRNIGFSTFRNTFDTVAMQLNDRDAVKAIMGHESADMIDVYNQDQVPLERRLAVVNHVRRWLTSANV